MTSQLSAVLANASMQNEVNIIHGLSPEIALNKITITSKSPDKHKKGA